MNNKIKSNQILWNYGGYLTTDIVSDADLKELKLEILESGGVIKNILEVEVYEYELTYTGVK